MMRRPCVITHPVVVNEGKPFEALQMDLSFHINDLDIYLLDYDDAKNDFNFHQVFTFNTLKELEAVKYLLQWQLAKALNPPIKVTQVVLDAMDKVPKAKFWVSGINGCGVPTTYPCLYSSIGGVWTVYAKVPKSLKIGDYVQANCALALEVLLQFNTEGKLLGASN